MCIFISVVNLLFCSQDEYEMLDSSGENGPHRSRTSSNLLYKNFEFCCIEPFTDLSREQLEVRRKMSLITVLTFL